MLLLTDRVDASGHIQQAIKQIRPYAVVPLHQALAKQPSNLPIVCDVEVGNEMSAKLLRTALKHHRPDPAVPMLFLARDNSMLTRAQAVDMRATEVIACNAPPAALLSSIERLATSHSGSKPRQPGPVESAASSAATALADLLDAAKQRKPVAGKALDQAAAAVLTAIKQAKIRAWLDIVWRYDDITYQHCLLVAGLVAAFSTKLGLTPQSQHLLSQAALIHDVGKARIAHGILNKTTPLSGAELRVMQTHPAIGHEMLVGQPGLDPNILDVVRHHHEYLDGSGYPDRLQGQQISGYVRLVTICDIYAALIERRSYKRPMPPQQAYAMLLDMGGKLDPSLVAAFHAVVTDSEAGGQRAARG